MVKTTLYLDDATASEVRRMAETEGRSQSEVIRDAIRDYAGLPERPKPKGIGKYRSGRSDISERAEEILRRASGQRR